MFRTFFTFEVVYWLKAMMVWVFLTVLTLLLFSVMVADDPLMEQIFFSNAVRNSSFVIHRVYGMTAVFGCLMVTAFVNSAAVREFACNTQQLIFTKPISKYSYLLGRFTAATLVSLIPMLGASLAIFIAKATSPDLAWGPTNWWAHLSSILIIAVPNTFFVAAVVFSIAVWTRSTLASFLGILGLMVLLSVSGALIGTLSTEWLASMADPFGDTALANTTKYWTASEKSLKSVTLTGVLLWNRIFWVAVGFIFLAAGCWKFSFETKTGFIGHLMKTIKTSVSDSFATPFHTTEIPTTQRHFGFMARAQQLLRMTWTELWATARSPVFICIIVGALLSVFASFSVRSTLSFGLSSLPVTFLMVESVRESLFQFQLALITFYAGVFVWKERDAKLDEIVDALPTETWLSYGSKFLALVVIAVMVMVTGIFCGVFYQLISRFFSFQLVVYVQELLVLDMVSMICLIALAILCHVVSPNKYIGYFLFIALVIANAVGWSLLGVNSNMVQYSSLPSYRYSDMFGRAPYSTGLRWFSSYWLLAASLIGIATVLLWPRGKERGFGSRIVAAIPRWTGGVRMASIVSTVCFVACGGWIYYNTFVENTWQSKDELQLTQANYEKKFKPKSDLPQPRVVAVRYDIDIFPETRGLKMRGTQTIENKEDVPIETIMVVASSQYDHEIKIEGAREIEHDDELDVFTYAVDPPMIPGQKRKMEFVVGYEPKGFENRVSVEQIVQNGTFLNNMITPQIGYQRGAEIQDLQDRLEFELTETSIPQLDPDNLEARQNSYLSANSDWVDIETVISTSADQIAIAPGALKKSWEEDGRKYFHYKLGRPSANFYSFVSARYEIAMRKWNDVDIEVYYHPDHKWNVDLMLRSVRKSLEYYSEAFGPYPHQQARIIEYPRVTDFAQAFPGTMPYAEGIGFIADLQDDDDIDMVFYVVAHEMAHQWWAHQVLGANMQGATLLSETLAQYSALMVMEKEYGRDMMRKFLKYEMDTYLRGRSREKGKEQPLQKVEFGQAYIHYNKGSVAMYHLKETIGEEKLNAALRSVVDKFAYNSGPYPTSIDLINAIRKQTPVEHRGLLKDLFEEITLFENRTKTAEYRKMDDDHYEVTIEVDFAKFRAESDGKENEVTINDWIEIGAFAKPESNSKFGKTLHRERIHVTDSTGKYTFVVNEEPALAGVDPNSLLIDRNGEDNLKKPVLKTD
jgi:hypothetical protein